MNPYDWISLYYIVTKDEKKSKSIIPHLRRMIICYIHEISRMNVEIASVLKKMSILKPIEQSKDIQKLKVGIIKKEHWSIIYNRKEVDAVQKSMFYLRDKHLYSTAALKSILSMVDACKANLASNLKYYLDTIKWYVCVRNVLLGLMPKLFDAQRRQQ